MGHGSHEAVLTLPGIAGIVLSIGMAVDANVIIFARSVKRLPTENNPCCGQYRI
jgi:SecD/SecF fusion protein